MKTTQLTLHLGGGSARGLAHTGVLKALAEAKIPFDKIVGVSMGAVVGGVYATYDSWHKTRMIMKAILAEETFKESFMGIWPQSRGKNSHNFLNRAHRLYLRTGALGRMLLSQSILPEEDIQEVFYKNYPNIFIQETKIPFACVAVDLMSGTTALFERGRLRESVLASSSIPMVFPPRKIEDRYYVDGVVLDRLGLDAVAFQRSRRRIAVDVCNPAKEKRPKASNALEIMIRAMEISDDQRVLRQYPKADVVLKPIARRVHLGEFAAENELFEMGYEHARSRIEEIRSSLGLNNPFKALFSFFNNF